MATEETQPAEVSCGNNSLDATEDSSFQRDKGGLGSDIILSQITKMVEAGIKRVLAAFDEKLRYDQTQKTQLDLLHAELLEHRTDLLAKATRPFAYGMIRIHGDIGRLYSALSQEETAEAQTSQRFLKYLDDLREDVELELEKHGIMTFRRELREVDPKCQRVVRRTLVEEPELDGVVHASISPGFEQGEYILVKEGVSVYKFSATFNGREGDEIGG